MQLFARKPLDQLQQEANANGLKRALGKWDLTALGVGAIIGAGIFATTGTAIAGGGSHIGAGPAIVLSFLITFFLRLSAFGKFYGLYCRKAWGCQLVAAY